MISGILEGSVGYWYGMGSERSENTDVNCLFRASALPASQICKKSVRLLLLTVKILWAYSRGCFLIIFDHLPAGVTINLYFKIRLLCFLHLLSNLFIFNPMVLLDNPGMRVSATLLLQGHIDVYALRFATTKMSFCQEERLKDRLCLC